ncbi:MAG: BTAD domain-containing putative transcriptional regulator [Microthrixaceae bacterium]
MAQLESGGRTRLGRPRAPQLNATILREDLIGVLRHRFERRLTVIAAGAGFGKSTLLAQAMAENRLERHGQDVWCPLASSDRDPAQLLSSIAASLGVDEVDPSVESLAEHVWSRAPDSVALILDDVHVLNGSAEAWGVLTDLLETLPDNGHLLFSGRTAPMVGISRLLSAGQAAVIGEQELSFSPAELTAFADLRGIPAEVADELPNWPALATLTGAVGKKAGLEFLWEEVLDTIEPDRVRTLAAATLFREVDDELVEALGGTGNASDLVAGLPLVDVTEGGTVRLHALWSDALAGSLSSDDRAMALRDGAAHLLERGELLRSAEAAAAAGDEEGLRSVVLEFATRPSLSASTVEIDRLHSLLPDSMASRPTAMYLEAARHYAHDDRLAAGLFARAADAARAIGLPVLETLALWRVVQFSKLDADGDPAVRGRIEELADEVPMARGIVAFLETVNAMERGEPERSIELLATVDGFSPDQLETTRAIQLMDLGRPEAVPATLEGVIQDGLTDIFGALAVWFQGAINPGDAWPIARELPARAEGLVAITRVGLFCSTATMAVSAGHYDEARQLADRALSESTGLPEAARLFADVAAALADLVTVDEETCTRRLSAILDEAPIGSWPIRPYLWALATVRALVPGTETLDDCRMGPSLTVAIQAGAAVAALRDGDPRPAAALPWQSLNLLRVHVPPPLLTELALAATGVPAAADVLADVPTLRPWVKRVAERRGHPAAGAAAALLERLPARPDYDLVVTTLGRFELAHSGGRTLEGWDRRGKVRDLMAMLVMRRRVGRDEIIGEMWPDLAPDKARANLRVTLHHLQAALQPERAGDDPPWFVRVESNLIELVREGVTIDHETLDELMAQAVTDEARGLATRALEGYAQVGELYGGDLLPEFDQEWSTYERIRLQSVAHAAAARSGELELARGEPEVAMKLGLEAQRLDPFSQRAHRLFVRCHLALDSAGSAQAAVEEFRARLASANLRPEPDTEALWRRLEADAPAS